MNAAIDPKAEVRAWIRKAETDFRSAHLLLDAGKDCPAEGVCFHAQQCVEKYLKSFLCLRGIDFPRNHDIGELVALLPKDVSLTLTDNDQERLTEYAVDSRYPEFTREISITEAVETAKIMDVAREAVRSALPKDVL